MKTILNTKKKSPKRPDWWLIFVTAFIAMFVVLSITLAAIAYVITRPEPEEQQPILEPVPPVEEQIQVEITEEAIEEPEPEEEPELEWISLGTFRLTAYCPCEKCCGYWATVRPLDEAGNPIVYTASGARAVAGTTIAVDPNVIPYGTEVKINDHIYIAQDTGGGIKEKHIDIYYDDHDAALNSGLYEGEVFIRNENYHE